MKPMLLLFTDFGYDGSYVGQVHSVLACHAEGIAVVDLMHDAPLCNPKASAYLLAALTPHMPEGCICIAVVDPGVGGPRPPLIVEADGRRFVGPGNGLFEIVTRRSRAAAARIIDWKPPRLSKSFHGRDLFAPVAAMLATGREPATHPTDQHPGHEWPDDLPEAIYADRFGNVMTGLRAATVGPDAVIGAGKSRLRAAATFSDVPPGEAFWYENSIGLVEIAVNSGNAARQLGMRPGDPVHVLA